jgi:N6-L-threonylcarbamoyladenine synthase
MLILGIESSCDETSAAILRDGRDILSLEIASQIAMHQPFGGVVPELASRGHLRRVLPIVDESLRDAGVEWDEIDAIAVTSGPGLIGALLVGTEAAKALAWLHGKPLIGVHHLMGHVDSVHLALKNRPATAPALPERKYPFLALVVSGGHTALYRVDGPTTVATLGETLDDAAGEAYDKVAKLLGLGYPGGPIVDKLAKRGRRDAYVFPRPLAKRGGYDFSYSGLKTAVLTVVRAMAAEGKPVSDPDIDNLCASFQEAAIDVLLTRAKKALEETGLRRLVVAGGVACNSRLRERLAELAAEGGCEVFAPAPILCTDNAAMIAGQAWAMLTDGDRRPWRDGLAESIAGLELNPRSSWPMEELTAGAAAASD